MASAAPGCCVVAALALAALVFGAANSVGTRALLLQPCPESCVDGGVGGGGGAAGAAPTFAKPVFSVVIAFAAMALSLPAAALLRCAADVPEGGGSGGGGGGGGGGSASAHESDAEREEAIAALRRKRAGGGRARLYEQLLTSSINDEDYGGGAGAGGDFDGGEGRGGDGAAAGGSSAGCAAALCAGAARYAPLVLPTLLDLLATALQGAAVLFVSAGVAAGLRGSLTLFAALAARLSGRGRDAGASRLEWAGVALATLGASGVGLSAFLDAGAGASANGPGAAGGVGSFGAVALGVVLSLLSNLTQGVQVAAETALVEEGAFSPLEVNGVEGLLGLIVALLALIAFQLAPAPAVAGAVFDNGHVEDSLGTICCLRDSPPVAAASGVLLLLFALSTAAFMALGAVRGGNFRALLMVARGALVWAAELALAALAGAAWWPDDGGAAARLGVAWAPHSWVALLGFVLLAAGGAVQWHGRATRDALARDEAGAEEARKLAAVVARLNEGLGALEMMEIGSAASRGGRR